MTSTTTTPTTTFREPLSLSPWSPLLSSAAVVAVPTTCGGVDSAVATERVSVPPAGSLLVVGSRVGDLVGAVFGAKVRLLVMDSGGEVVFGLGASLVVVGSDGRAAVGAESVVRSNDERDEVDPEVDVDALGPIEEGGRLGFAVGAPVGQRTLNE